jgi:wobble nucleotide-excising tRNase
MFVFNKTKRLVFWGLWGLIIFVFFAYFFSCSKGSEKDIFEVEKKLKEIEDLKAYSPEDWERLNKLLQEAKIAQVRKFEIKSRKIIENLEKEIELAKGKLEKLKSESKELEKSKFQIPETGVQGFQEGGTGAIQELLR